MPTEIFLVEQNKLPENILAATPCPPLHPSVPTIIYCFLHWTVGLPRFLYKSIRCALSPPFHGKGLPHPYRKRNRCRTRDCRLSASARRSSRIDRVSSWPRPPTILPNTRDGRSDFHSFRWGPYLFFSRKRDGSEYGRAEARGWDAHCDTLRVDGAVLVSS